jgi:hypothetical protein
MRYDQLMVPGLRPQLSVATRTLPPGYDNYMDEDGDGDGDGDRQGRGQGPGRGPALRPLVDVLDKHSARKQAHRMPAYERLLRGLGLAGLVECVSYASVSCDEVSSLV